MRQRALIAVRLDRKLPRKPAPRSSGCKCCEAIRAGTLTLCFGALAVFAAALLRQHLGTQLSVTAELALVVPVVLAIGTLILDTLVEVAQCTGVKHEIVEKVRELLSKKTEGSAKESAGAFSFFGERNLITLGTSGAAAVAILATTVPLKPEVAGPDKATPIPVQLALPDPPPVLTLQVDVQDPKKPVPVSFAPAANGAPAMADSSKELAGAIMQLAASLHSYTEVVKSAPPGNLSDLRALFASIADQARASEHRFDDIGKTGESAMEHIKEMNRQLVSYQAALLQVAAQARIDHHYLESIAVEANAAEAGHVDLESVWLCDPPQGMGPRKTWPAVVVMSQGFSKTKQYCLQQRDAQPPKEAGKSRTGSPSPSGTTGLNQPAGLHPPAGG